jgi:hypothetical protein
VIYVDPYPGISMLHVLKSGPDHARPQLRLFSGAVGHAYHRLYEAILSTKDEYHARLSAVEAEEVELSDAIGDERTPELWDRVP